MLRDIFSVLLMCLLAAASVWADFQAGLDAYEQGDYKIALKEWKPLR